MTQREWLDQPTEIERRPDYFLCMPCGVQFRPFQSKFSQSLHYWLPLLLLLLEKEVNWTQKLNLFIAHVHAKLANVKRTTHAHFTHLAPKVCEKETLMRENAQSHLLIATFYIYILKHSRHIYIFSREKNTGVSAFVRIFAEIFTNNAKAFFMHQLCVFVVLGQQFYYKILDLNCANLFVT